MNLKNLKGYIFISMSALITACSSTPDSIHYKTGAKATILTCPSATWSPCLEQAGKICGPSGYEILEKMTGRSKGIFYDSDVREMIITCNQPKIGS